ncbi:hypothetical protein BC834DRAFT_271076 [Gloeopeniophorella convolvens]|nr:hypothetical protein BC834DRAFT_271076 [Gloeopeniophorella convolvens]
MTSPAHTMSAFVTRMILHHLYCNADDATILHKTACCTFGAHPQDEQSRMGCVRASDSHPPQHDRAHAHHPPVPPAPQLTVSTRRCRARALYACDSPEGVQYYGLPFFQLFLGDEYEVLKEAGHPSRHRDLPLFVDEGEDCLLNVRSILGKRAAFAHRKYIVFILLKVHNKLY